MNFNRMQRAGAVVGVSLRRGAVVCCAGLGVSVASGERLTTATSSSCVGIMKHKFRRQFVVDVVHLGANNRHHSLRRNEHSNTCTILRTKRLNNCIQFDTFVGDGIVEFISRFGKIERVGHAIATARFHTESKANHRLVV